MNDKVSIILPSLNVADYIDECINSVRNQTYDNLEIICVDAGSEDGTIRKLNEHAKNDARIKIVNFTRKSYGAQVNYGISVATGKYIAIVETDDFVAPEMMEKMHKAIASSGTNYVKCDYNKFFCQEDGRYNYSSIYQFNGLDVDKYDVVINPHEMDYLYRSDYNIWRGLYDKAFLNSNHIELNESDGAAYQDIGFMERTMAAASKAVYIRGTLYNYRTDRTEASSYSPKCLKNTMTEFDNYLRSNDERTYLPGLYQHIAIAFLKEYEKTLIATGYDVDSDYCREYYTWFKDILRKAIDDDIFNLSMLSTEDSKELGLLLDSPKLFSECCQRESLRRQHYYDEIRCDAVLIFGSGKKGYSAMQILKEKGIQICAFIDNDKRKQGTTIDGIAVLSPDEAFKRFIDIPVLVEHETKYMEIIDQIKGIKSDVSIYCAYEGKEY